MQIYFATYLILLFTCFRTHIYSTPINSILAVTKLGTCRAKLDNGSIIDLSNKISFFKYLSVI